MAARSTFFLGGMIAGSLIAWVVLEYLCTGLKWVENWQNASVVCPDLAVTLTNFPEAKSITSALRSELDSSTAWYHNHSEGVTQWRG